MMNISSQLPISSAPPAREMQQPSSNLSAQVNQVHYVAELNFSIHLPKLFSSHHQNIKLSQQQKETLKNLFLSNREAVKKNINDIGLRVDAIELKLQVAPLGKSDIKDSYLEDAKLNITYLKELNYFTPAVHYCEFLINAFEGIDCSKMDQVKQALLPLLRAAFLSPNENKYKTTLDKVKEGILQIFSQLLTEKHINMSMLEILKGNLYEIFSSDPFLEELKKETSLLRKAPKAIAEKYSFVTSLISENIIKDIYKAPAISSMKSEQEIIYPGIIEKGFLDIEDASGGTVKKGVAFRYLDSKSADFASKVSVIQSSRVVTIAFRNHAIHSIRVHSDWLKDITDQAIQIFILFREKNLADVLDLSVQIQEVKPEEYKTMLSQLKPILGSI